MTDIHEQVRRAHELRPLIEAEGREIDERRELTPNVVAALKAGGFFRMLKTKEVGGMELHPKTFSLVTEALSSMDASTAWVVCQGNGCSTSSAYLPQPVAQEMFGTVDGILAWGPPGPFKAEPVPGGYRINGTWRFASGCQNATWLGAHIRTANTNELLTFLFPKASATMTDIWHTVGLRGTASNQYSAKDLFVPMSHVMHRDDPKYRNTDSLLYRFTSGQLYSIGFAGVALGIAKGTIDEFLRLPSDKVARGAAKPMRENNVVQSQLAQCVARWRSARVNLHATVDEAWSHVEQTGEMTADDRAMLRLASTWAIQQSREVVNTLYHAMGSMVVFEEQPYERRLRDINTVAQQGQGRQLHFETVGQIMLGLKPENQF